MKNCAAVAACGGGGIEPNREPIAGLWGVSLACQTAGAACLLPFGGPELWETHS